MSSHPSPKPSGPVRSTSYRPKSDAPFFAVFVALAAAYVVLIVAMLAADLAFTSWADLRDIVGDPNVQYSAALSLVTCTIAALASLVVAIPIGYLLSRFEFRGKNFLDAVLDIPIVLPPLVVGLSLLVLFRRDSAVGGACEWAVLAVCDGLGINAALESFGLRPIRGLAYEIPAVILAQFAVSCAFAVRTLRLAFDQLDVRAEQVAWTLGCNRRQAFFRVVLPEAWPGVVSAGCLAWARGLGEFGPVLVFAGTTRMKTEVLPSTIFLELSIGNVEGAVAVSILLVTAAMVVLVLARAVGLRRGFL